MKQRSLKVMFVVGQKRVLEGEKEDDDETMQAFSKSSSNSEEE